jgi:hypothetical protein
MTNEERDLITQFIGRVSGARPAAQPSFGGSVPATQQRPDLPPIDPEADRLIADLFSRYPEARYRLTQLAFVQEHGLNEAQNRIQRLEWELQQAQQTVQQAQQQQPRGSGGGFFSGLFGGGARSAPPPPQGAPGWNQGGPQSGGYQQAAPPPPQYAPGYQQGMFQRPGSGFLGSALTTAAGVAGGLVAGNALMSLFSGGGRSLGGGGFGGGAPPAGSPWGAPPADQGYIDQGTWDTSGGQSDPGNSDPGYVDNGTWDTSGGDQSSFTDDNSGGGDWDTSTGSNDDTF